MTELLRLPTGVEPYISTERLLDDIKAFMKKNYEAAEQWFDIMALYVLMTWVFDRFTAVPYLRFQGEWGTGKTRALEVTAELSYNSQRFAGNITGAVLFRSIDGVRGTLCIAEADCRFSDATSDIAKVFNGGYKVGFPVLRCGTAEQNFPINSFYIYGPKILTTRLKYSDEATESRCLTFETTRQKLRKNVLRQIIPLNDAKRMLQDPDITPEDRTQCELAIEYHETAQSLRNRLLAWRFEHWRTTFPREEGLKHLSNRACEIGASLAAVCPNSEWLNRLVTYLSGRDSKESMTAYLIHSAMLYLRGQKCSKVSPKQIAETVKESEGTIISSQEVGSVLRSYNIPMTRGAQGMTLVLEPAIAKVEGWLKLDPVSVEKM